MSQLVSCPKNQMEQNDNDNVFEAHLVYSSVQLVIVPWHFMQTSLSNDQGHPTSIFGKYLFGRRFEI